jgi:hypothetical protein
VSLTLGLEAQGSAGEEMIMKTVNPNVTLAVFSSSWSQSHNVTFGLSLT